MKLPSFQYGSVWKRRGTRFLAAFFVLYAVLDISVLQVYCGNEEIGLPAAMQLTLKSESPAPEKAQADGHSLSGAASSPENDPPNDAPRTDDACFCCCSHSILANNSTEAVANRPAQSGVSAPNFPTRHLHPDSHPTDHYQPPKFS